LENRADHAGNACPVGWLVGLLAVLLLTLTFAATPVAAQSTADFQAWLQGVRKEAASRGYDRATVNAVLDGVQPVQSILQHDKKQHRAKTPLEDYLARVLKPNTVSAGLQASVRHRDLLRRVEQRFGVQPRFVLAIWGMESLYGTKQGTSNVVPAIATLAYDQRRSSFFRNELFSLMEMVQRGYATADGLKGSWAGAMGQPQFMPSSYIKYARDFDGDGRRDIWRNTGDVFASIANYLAAHGWRNDQTWGREVRLPSGFAGRMGALRDPEAKGCIGIRKLTVRKTLPQWSALGLRNVDGGPLPAVPVQASLIQPDGPGGRAFLVYDNYRATMAYNCSNLYAIAMGLLSDRFWTD
jgi:membrane-bound lytic murein transglycosylase B